PATADSEQGETDNSPDAPERRGQGDRRPGAQRLRAISSLPALRSSASSLSVQPRTADTTAPDISTATGMTTTRTSTMRTAPSMAPSSPDPRPRLHFDQRAQRQLGHAHRGPSRPVVAEGLHVRLVH